MAASSKSTKGQGSFGDSLQKLLSDIAQLQALPDADLDFCSTLQQAVVGKIRSIGTPPTSSPTGPGATPSPMPAGANPGMGGLSATGAGPMPPMSPDMGAAGASGSVPNMDEMNRMLGSNSTVS